MRISLLMFSTGFGGAERHVLDLAAALGRQGNQVQLVCRSGFFEAYRGLLADLDDVAIVNAKNNWDIPAVWAIKKAVQKFRSELLHTHLSRATVLGGYAAKWLNLPCVCTTHNLIKPKYIRPVSHFIATTSAQVSHLLDVGVGREKVRLIPNFSLFPVENVMSEMLGESLVFVAYGRFVKKKGFDLLIEAFAQVSEKYAQARLILGGDGSEDQALRQQVDHLGLMSQVDFYGWVGDVHSLLEKGDVFVLPSRDEPFGIVLLEAMSKGLPIVTSAASGPLEVLDSELAWFAEVGDSDSLARAMCLCAESPEVRMQKAQLARQRYTQNYHVDKVVPGIIEYYEELTALA